jgi:hypothetical protein
MGRHTMRRNRTNRDQRGGFRVRFLIALIGLFPVWWQQRYREEFTAMVIALVNDRRRDMVSLTADIVLAIVDTYACGQSIGRPAATVNSVVMPRPARDGLVVGVLLAVELVVTNVALPASSDDRGWGSVEEVVSYSALFAALAVIGARSRRRAATRHAATVGGAIAGVVVAVMALLTMVAVDNLFFDTISRQPDKLAAFARSGASSLRSYVNLNLLHAAPVIVPALGVVGGLLGSVGGLLVSSGTRRSDSPAGTA